MNAPTADAIRQARESLDAHVAETVAWHFHESTGCPFWLEFKKKLPFDPLKEVRSIPRTFGFAPDTLGAVVVVVALAGFVWGWHALARRFAFWPAWCQRHPQLCLHACFWAWLLALWNVTTDNVTARTVLFGAALMFPLLLWRRA